MAISSQYLNNEQIRVYLEACLDRRITDFEVKDINGINQDLYIREEFERLKKKKTFPGQDNLFYRVWVYQYEGLRELMKQSLETFINPVAPINENAEKNSLDIQRQKGVENESKCLSFRFTFGKIDLKDLQKQNLLYQQLIENPNGNIDQYEPTEKDIASKTENLKIIFLYMNLGTPLLEEDCEVEESENGIRDRGKKRERYFYKYEFDVDRIVYYRKISFSLYKMDENIEKCICRPIQEYYWLLQRRKEDKEPQKGKMQYYCQKCFDQIQDKSNYIILENTKYSITYKNYCNKEGHYTKKYEFYCNDCNKAYCVKCLTNEHKDLNFEHRIVDIMEKDITPHQMFTEDKKQKFYQKRKKNDEIWESINEAEDKAEISLRERQKKAIVNVKNEVLSRCTFLTSIGYELQRMIGEIDSKRKFIEDLRKDSNVANYLEMNNQFAEDMRTHYLPNLEYIERMDLSKFLDTFHKIDKK